MSEQPSDLHLSEEQSTIPHSTALSARDSQPNDSEIEESEDPAASDGSSGDESELGGETLTGGTECGSRTDALVSIVTADFAMQNLILQLGLQLVSPDGRQITRISRWALRCSACFKVTKVSISHL